MRDRPASRKPMAVRLDDPGVTVTVPRAEASDLESPPRPDAVAIVAGAVPAAPPAMSVPAAPRRGVPLGALFWAATGSLVALGFGLAATRLIEDLFSRAEWLGWLGSGLAVVSVATLSAMVTREVLGLARLSTVEKLQARALAALSADDRNEAGAVVRELIKLLRLQPRLARARAEMHAHLGDIIDGADLIRLAERQLLAQLDVEARHSVAAAAKRVSLVTAVSPRAALDMIFVLLTALALVRRLSELYGSRPGMLGLIRLFRHVIAHLAVTGGMAATDGLVQQILGHGVAAKVSARLGEGVLNGLLTARLGLAAIEVARPLPFAALKPPALADLAAGLVKLRTPHAAAEP